MNLDIFSFVEEENVKRNNKFKTIKKEANLLFNNKNIRKFSFKELRLILKFYRDCIVKWNNLKHYKIEASIFKKTFKFTCEVDEFLITIYLELDQPNNLFFNLINNQQDKQIFSDYVYYNTIFH